LSDKPSPDHPWRQYCSFGIPRTPPQRRVRTVRDELLDKEIEKATRIDQVRYGNRDAASAVRRDPSYSPLAGGGAMRKSVRYE
jgi:hypothetical protein